MVEFGLRAANLDVFAWFLLVGNTVRVQVDSISTLRRRRLRSLVLLSCLHTRSALAGARLTWRLAVSPTSLLQVGRAVRCLGTSGVWVDDRCRRQFVVFDRTRSRVPVTHRRLGFRLGVFRSQQLAVDVRNFR